MVVGVEIVEPRREAPRQQLREPTLALASFPPPIAQNPYQRLLYGALEEAGVRCVRGNRLKLDWLLRHRRQVQVLHFHWPEGYYRYGDGAGLLGAALSWLRLGLFALRLRAARLLGFRIAWTAHQTAPHESSSARLDRLGVGVLGRACRVIAVHEQHAVSAVERLAGSSTEVVVVPHGSYIGWYPERSGRVAARRALGVADDATVFLSFGHLRGYKNLELLLEGFAATAEALPRAALVVAGLPLDLVSQRVVADAAREDERIILVDRFIADEDVADLFAAADAAVLARSDGGTSGALILALSQGVPVVVSDQPAYTELTAGGLAGWIFASGSAADLTRALVDAGTAGASDLDSRGRAARAIAESRRWETAAELFAAALRRAAV